MVEQNIQRFSRKCSSTGREIGPGEVYYSSLSETPTGIQRLDFSSEAWSGPPDECLGWWKSRLPLSSQTKIRWAPDTVLLAYFENLFVTQRWDVLNVLVLALARRRIMTIEYPANNTSTTGDPNTGDELLLTVRSTGDTHRIPQVDFSSIDVAGIQAELDQHLFTDQIQEEPVEPEPTE
ncbi:MAG: hypothetical protein Q8M16_05860 [Pirellulaceae bacterium]|nr:hypothetical protein [Pirellulaceae bacterium]